MAENTKTMEPILAVRDLKVSFTTPDGDVNAVKGISLDVRPGEAHCPFRALVTLPWVMVGRGGWGGVRRG